MIQTVFTAPPTKTVHPRRLVLAPVLGSYSRVMQYPAAPNPAGDAGVLPEFGNLNLQDAPSPPVDEGELDVLNLSRETAMKVIARAIIAMANATGDVPASPAISRPGTPGGSESSKRHHRRTLSRPATPIPPEKERHQAIELDPSEAHHDEPVTVHDIGAGAQPEAVQRANMARKFFSKSVPKVGVEEYMNRIQRFCPLSTAVWLAAGSYILRLCVIDRVVPLTYRTMHRLILACTLVAMKALEDHRWPQKRFAAVGGVDEASLTRLELCVEFLLDFRVQIFTPEKLKDVTVSLQRAGRAATLANRLPSTFNLQFSNPKFRQGQVA